MNEGKNFELDFQKSVEEDIFLYRLRDCAGWQTGEATRFAPKNICDYIGFYNGILYLLELKSTKLKSLPFNNIKDNQLNELLKANAYKDIKCYIVINFRELEETWGLNIADIVKLKEEGKKSIPILYCRENGIKLEHIKKRVRYKYDIKNFFNKIKGV